MLPAFEFFIKSRAHEKSTASGLLDRRAGQLLAIQQQGEWHNVVGTAVTAVRHLMRGRDFSDMRDVTCGEVV